MREPELLGEIRIALQREVPSNLVIAKIFPPTLNVTTSRSGNGRSSTAPAASGRSISVSGFTLRNVHPSLGFYIDSRSARIA